MLYLGCYVILKLCFIFVENVSSVTISNTITIMHLSIFRDLPVNTENTNFLMFFCSVTQFRTRLGISMVIII